MTSLYRKLRALVTHRRGTAALEFALVAPVVLTGLLGTVELGRLFWVRSTIQYATEETARYALANTDAGDGDLENYARSKLLGLSSADSNAVSVSVDRETIGGTNFISIQASYPFTNVASLIPGGPYTLTGSARTSLNN